MRQIGFISVLFLFTFCAERKNGEGRGRDNQHQSEADIPHLRDTLLTINYVEVAMYKPKNENVNATLLLLPGWNYPYNHWYDSTSIQKLADSLGYNLVMPSMRKTIYQDSIYPETRKDWKNEKTVHWLTDTLIPFLQLNYGVLKMEQCNFVLGISTGGKGVGVLALRSDGVFTAGAALSGDFDLLNYPNDALNEGFLGPKNTFEARWKREDLLTKSREVKFPLLLCHGASDSVVPFAQSASFWNACSKGKVAVTLFKKDKGAHDYPFWNEAIKEAMTFFETKSQSAVKHKKRGAN